MSIKRAPLKTDEPGKCTRWRVRVYNRDTHKEEEHTFHGILRDAQAFERAQRDKLGRGTYVSRSERQSIAQLAASLLSECRARGRRTNTLRNYESVLENYIVPKFGPREASSVRKADVRGWLNELLAEGKSVELINRIIRTFKRVLFHGLDLEVLERNVLMRFAPFAAQAHAANPRRMKRGAFTQEEVRALIEAARPHERALIGLLCLAGARPGEAFALRWQDVDLEAGSARIARTWDWRGQVFTPPKTAAGVRTIALAPWICEQLEAHQALTREAAPEALVFASRTGTPMNPSNVRRDMWLKLRARAEVRELDMYSLRHTFATFARVAGEEAFNVARAMGHSRSNIVDAIYAHSLPSGMASVAKRVATEALGKSAARARPRLRVIEGGTRDTGKTREKIATDVAKKAVTP